MYTAAAATAAMMTMTGMTSSHGKCAETGVVCGICVAVTVTGGLIIPKRPQVPPVQMVARTVRAAGSTVEVSVFQT